MKALSLKIKGTPQPGHWVFFRKKSAAKHPTLDAKLFYLHGS